MSYLKDANGDEACHYLLYGCRVVSKDYTRIRSVRIRKMTIAEQLRDISENWNHTLDIECILIYVYIIIIIIIFIYIAPPNVVPADMKNIFLKYDYYKECSNNW